MCVDRVGIAVEVFLDLYAAESILTLGLAEALLCKLFTSYLKM